MRISVDVIDSIFALKTIVLGAKVRTFNSDLYYLKKFIETNQ